MILYFSATGNGKYISEQIAERTNETCMSIVDCIREDKYSFYDPVRQAAWRRTLWHIMDRSLMLITV